MSEEKKTTHKSPVSNQKIRWSDSPHRNLNDAGSPRNNRRATLTEFASQGDSLENCGSGNFLNDYTESQLGHCFVMNRVQRTSTPKRRSQRYKNATKNVIDFSQDIDISTSSKSDLNNSMDDEEFTREMAIAYSQATSQASPVLRDRANRPGFTGASMPKKATPISVKPTHRTQFARPKPSLNTQRRNPFVQPYNVIRYNPMTQSIPSQQKRPQLA